MDNAIPASSVLHDCEFSWKRLSLRLHDSKAIEKTRTLQVLRSKQSGPNQVFSTCQWRCVSNQRGDKPKVKTCCPKLPIGSLDKRQRLDLFCGNGCKTMKVSLDTVGQCRAELG